MKNQGYMSWPRLLYMTMNIPTPTGQPHLSYTTYGVPPHTSTPTTCHDYNHNQTTQNTLQGQLHRQDQTRSDHASCIILVRNDINPKRHRDTRKRPLTLLIKQTTIITYLSIGGIKYRTIKQNTKQQSHSSNEVNSHRPPSTGTTIFCSIAHSRRNASSPSCSGRASSRS